MSEVTTGADDSRFRRGLLLVSSSSLANLVLLFLELIVIARLLSTSGYGRYVLLVAAANFVVMICDAGCKLSVTQFIATGDRTRQEEVVASALIFRTVTMLAATALVLGVYAATRTTGWSTGLDQYLVYLPIMFVSASYDELLYGMLQGFQAYRPMAATQIVRGVLRLGLTTVLLLVFHAGMAALVASWSIALIAAIVIEYLALPTHGQWRWRRETLVEVLRFGRSLQVMRFLSFVSARVHITLLGLLAGVDSVAFFAAANRIPDALTTLSDSFTRVYFPAISGHLAAGRKAEAEALMQRSLRLLAIVCALGAVCSAVFSHELMVLLFSAKYARAAPAFGLLMVAFYIATLVNVLGYTLTANGRPARALWLDTGQAVALLLLDLAMIPFFGAAGAAAAAVIGTYISAPIGVWMVRRIGLALDIRPYVRQAAILAVCFALVWTIRPDDLRIALLFRAGVLELFCVLSLLLRTFGTADIAVLLSRRGTGPSKAASVDEPSGNRGRSIVSKRRICIIAFKPVRQCVHVLRQIEYLATDFELTVIGYGEADAGWGLTHWFNVPEPTLLSKAAKAFWFTLGRLVPRAYDRWYWTAGRHKQAYRHALASGANAFHANDWQSLPIAVRAARQTGARVVFHMHEYAEEERTDSRLWRLLVAPAVRYLIKKYTAEAHDTIDAYITVCDPIAERYARELGTEVRVVFNAPKPVATLPVEDAVAQPRQIRMIHHGYAKRGRGLHRLIEALARTDERFRLDFMLVDDDEGYIDELKALADRIAAGRVGFRTPVPPDNIVATVAGYDLGLCVIEPSSYNNLMMLPNKFFEYVQAGLAVCVGPSPAMAALVRRYDLGVVAESFEPLDVARALNGLDANALESMRRAAREAATVLNADVEMGKVVTIYRRMFDATPVAVG
jgi:O-antigen/teichoic acid export membrane protein